MPGTRIPITQDSQLSKLKKKTPIINLAWHISREIKAYLKKIKINNRVIDILNSNDFK